MNKLIIAGLGVKDLKQLTLDTYEALQKADSVLYLGTDSKTHFPQLKKLGCQKLESILELYRDGEIDEVNYKTLFQFVIDTVAKHTTTLLLVPGHPRVGVTLVQRLCQYEGPIDVQVLPGISSLDTMMNDLAVDPLEKGSIIIDANRALLFELKWSSHLDCYLYHVCSVGTRRVYLQNAQKANRWDLLKEHLLSIYSPNAQIKLISSATKESQLAQIQNGQLSELEKFLPHVHFGTTLFIQGERPQSFNQKFLALLAEEPGHVRLNTHT